MNDRLFVENQLKREKGGGHGQYAKIAEALGVHSTFVSLVFNEKRDFSMEQALLLAGFLKLTEGETEYFLDLVQLARAGNHQLKAYYRERIKRAQEESKKLSTKFAHEKQLEAEERQIFYSSWHYSAIRVFTSTHPSGRSIEEIAERLKLPRQTVVEALSFLVHAQLVVEKKGRYSVGPQRTFLERRHPLLKCHHNNWRQKALNQFEQLTDDEMMFTSTMSLSRKDFLQLRERLSEIVKEASDLMQETDPEDVAFLNIDFSWIK
jgi:uncharacterized protein (TIGR02147 family)